MNKTPLTTTSIDALLCSAMFAILFWWQSVRRPLTLNILVEAIEIYDQIMGGKKLSVWELKKICILVQFLKVGRIQSSVICI